MHAKSSNSLQTKKIWIVIGCCCLQIAVIGLPINTAGLFVSSVCSDMDFSVGSFTMYRTIQGLISAMMLPLAARVLEKKNFKKVLFIAIVCMGVGTLFMSTFQQLWQFYVCGFIIGVANSFLCVLPIPMVIDKWFTTGKATYLSLASCFSGLTGIVMSPVIANIIEWKSWRFGYIIVGIGILALGGIAVFLIEKQPHIRRNKIIRKNNTEKEKVLNKKSLLVFSFLFIQIAFSFCTSIANHLSNYIISVGYTMVIASTFNSVLMVGNMGSKLLLGRLCDKIGSSKTAIGGSLICILGYVFLGYTPNIVIMYGGAFMCGLSFSLAAVVIPMLIKELFFQYSYAKTLAFFSMIGSIAASVGISIIGFAFDYFDSYKQGLFIYQGLLIISVFSLVWYRRYKTMKK